MTFPDRSIVNKSTTVNNSPSPTTSAPPAPPVNPKIQAVTFAIELAKVRATSGMGGAVATTARQLVVDAQVIADFIGPAVPPRTFQ